MRGTKKGKSTTKKTRQQTTPGCVFMTQPPLPRPPMAHRASPTSALYRIQVISYKVCTCRAGPVRKSRRTRFLLSRQSKYANTRALPTHGVYRSRDGLAQANGFCLRFLRVVCLCGRAVQELLLCTRGVVALPTPAVFRGCELHPSLRPSSTFQSC